MTEFITIRGARENNLQDVSLQIPKRKLTIFTGVSGSGKSSIVFDTIATEAQRQLYENFSLFIRNFLPKYPQPDADALEFFSRKEILRKMQAMRDVGLGYLALGQPLSTLSGGECQRLKLAGELHKDSSIYVMDEPTTGLHMSDITHLVAIMDRLADGRNSVIVIEHNLEVIRNADWIIDLGPEGGSKGGEVVFAGTPMALVKNKQSLTGQYLRQ
jgi:excinuclease UvrABC ATPase subunit